MKELQQEFEQWVAQEFPYTIMSDTFNKSYTNNGTFICYTVGVVHKMWQAWEGALQSRENIDEQESYQISTSEGESYRAGNLFSSRQ